jgi:hypothetical protein
VFIERDVPKNPPASLFEFSKDYCNSQIDHAVAQIVPVVKRYKGAGRPARTSVGESFIRLHEVHYSGAGETIAYSLIDVDDDYVRFKVFRRR